MQHQPRARQSMPSLDRSVVISVRSMSCPENKQIGSAEKVLRSPVPLARMIAGLLVCLVASGMPHQVSASLLLLQSGGGEAGGKLFVPGPTMAGQCTTMVTPRYPIGALAGKPESALLVLRVRISRMGNPSPLYLISGPPAFENEAMNAVRTWKYRPYLRDGEAVDVISDVGVTFTPGQAAGIVTHPNR